MADDYWRRIVKETVAETTRLIEEYKREVMDTLWPMLVEMEAPAQRLAYYDTLDWDALAAISPILWQKYSGDALELAKQQQTKEYAQYQSDLARAFRPQQEPLSYSASKIEPFLLGHNMPLPLGRTGA